MLRSSLLDTLIYYSAGGKFISTLEKTLVCTIKSQLPFYPILRANNSSRERNIRAIIQRLCSASTPGLLDVLTVSCTDQYPYARFYPVARIIPFPIVLARLSV